MRIRRAAVVVAILVCSACSRGGGNDARFERSSGWLVSKVSDDNGQAAAAGDEKHVWVWSKGKPGVRVLDRAGNLSKPLLTNVQVGMVIATGDHHHGLVIPDETPGLFLISTDPDEERGHNLLPDGLIARNAHRVEGGVWIDASPPEQLGVPVEGKIVYFDARSQRLFGPWDFASLRGGYSSRYAIDLSSTDQKFTATIVDNQSGVVAFPIKVAAGKRPVSAVVYPQIMADGRYVWGASFLTGAFRIDLPAAVKARLEHRPYEPFIVAANRTMSIAVLNSDRIVTYEAFRSQKLRGATIIDVGSGVQTPVLADDLVLDVRVIDPTTWLAAVQDRAGTLHAVLVSNLIERSELSTVKYLGSVIKTADPRTFLLIYRDVVRLDLARKDAEPIVRSSNDDDAYHYQSPGRFTSDANDHLFWIVAPTLKPFRGGVVYDVSSGKLLNADHALFSREPDLPAIVPFGDGTHAVALGESIGTMLIDRRAPLPPFRLRLGNDELTADDVPDEVAFDPGAAFSIAAFSIKDWPKPLNADSKVELHLACGGAEWSASGNASSTTGLNEMYGKRNPLTPHKPCRATATFSDAYGSQFVWRWSGFRLVPPTAMYERPWFRSLALFVFICIFVAIGASLRGGIQRWAPLAIYAGGGFIGTITGVNSREIVDLPLLLALLGGGFAVTCLFGILSPSAFRELERIEPFRSLAPFAVSVGSIRRRLYASYVQRVSDDVDDARRRANAEVYSAVPLQELGARQAALDASRHPADALLDLLTARDLGGRAHVLIESTGGRGKSALVREVIQRALAQFRNDPRAPLPIVCDGGGATLFERAKEKLGVDDGFSDELLRVLLRAGEFFLVVDGLTEQHVDAAMLREQLANYGTRCPLLLAGRPNDALRTAVESARAWVTVEPRRLDDDTTLAAFLSAYGRTADDFPDSTRDACRHRGDGTYLPILVRLAILPQNGRASTIAGIYDTAIHTLLDEKGISLDDAVDLCFATYWHDGQRQIVYALAEEERKAVLKKLVDAGLLVPADLGHSGASEPRMVQFFHDTMQSYLTAVALSRQDDWRDVLLRAAGEPLFVRDQSDLAVHGSSELFQMCLYVFEPAFKTRELLQHELLRLAKQYPGALSRDWVVHESGIGDLGERIDATIAGGSALEIAIRHADEDREIWSHGVLYASVARFLWKRIDEDRRKVAEQEDSSVA